MSALSIYLFGKFCVRCGEQVKQGLDACKAQELLSYLLIYRDRPHARETLAGMLWGESSTEKSKKYLRQALWQLQTALDTQGQTGGGHMLVVEHDWVQFNSNADLWLDVARFEEAFALAQGSSGRDMDARQTQAIQLAVQLYKGDLLEGWYQDWCLYERERLQNMYLAMLDKLMSYCEAHHQYEMGLIYGSLILRFDRARERTHRQLMKLQYLSGDRTAALRQYERCATALDEELGVKPDKRTAALYQQIKADHFEIAPATSTESQPDMEATPVSLSELLGRLKHLQTILADVQHHVQKDIRAVELTLNEPR
jgi:DNA-binding SARP family transcriptional activator